MKYVVVKKTNEAKGERTQTIEGIPSMHHIKTICGFTQKTTGLIGEIIGKTQKEDDTSHVMQSVVG